MQKLTSSLQASANKNTAIGIRSFFQKATASRSVTAAEQQPLEHTEHSAVNVDTGTSQDIISSSPDAVTDDPEPSQRTELKANQLPGVNPPLPFLPTQSAFLPNDRCEGNRDVSLKLTVAHDHHRDVEQPFSEEDGEPVAQQGEIALPNESDVSFALICMCLCLFECFVFLFCPSSSDVHAEG